MAERQGQMDELTLSWCGRHSVVRHAFGTAIAPRLARTPPTLSVNISATALRDAKFVELLSDYCRGTGSIPHG